MAKRIINFEAEKEKGIKEMITEFIDFKITQGCSQLTMKNYNSTFRWFEDYDFDFMELLKTKSDASPAKFNVPYSCINAFYNWCVLQEYILKNPLLKSGLKKIRDDGNIRVVNIPNIQKLLSVIDLNTYVGLRDKAIIMIMLDSGVRPKEIFGLTIEDFTGDTLIIQKKVAKTRQLRVVPVSKIVSTQIKKIIALKPCEWSNNYIFCSYDGLQMHVEMFDKRLKKYSKDADVNIKPYDLRHSFATMYLNNNGNVFSLQKIMGHSDLRMTKRYIAITDEQLVEQHKTNSPINNILRKNMRIDKI